MKFLSLICGVIFLQSCTGQTQKINAVSFVAAGKPATQEHVSHIVGINTNYAAIMPFGFIKSLDTPTILHNTERQWFGETKDGAKQYATLLQENNISVMIKPQIWIWRGEFTGHLKMKTEKDWQLLEASYTDFILTYAALAQEIQAEIFCIGTELEQFIILRPNYWKRLISDIKKTYKGKLTYAANWDEYKRVPFWSELDYIGVDAYFPVSEEKTPSIEQVKIGWQQWKDEMSQVSNSHNRPVLFTEYGYRSVDFAGKEPWLSDRSKTGVNLIAQENLMRGLFEEIYPESWFAGGFIWKWFIEDERVGGHENNMFTPQNKPVEDIIKKHFTLEK